MWYEGKERKEGGEDFNVEKGEDLFFSGFFFLTPSVFLYFMIFTKKNGAVIVAPFFCIICVSLAAPSV